MLHVGNNELLQTQNPRFSEAQILCLGTYYSFSDAFFFKFVNYEITRQLYIFATTILRGKSILAGTSKVFMKLDGSQM